MRKIKPLDPHVADLIAAGEVVERPGAVVKELVENAIDAGATQIAVQIENGGMRAIRVTDNGSGIDKEDVKTAFLRHATSKIASEFDLEAIGTLGFRGEALAAIAAVSRVELLTRTCESQMGSFLTLEGGVPGELVPMGCPQGTSILVQDLFYNTPARMKFVKKDLAEGLYAAGLMQKIALSHPDIAIRFVREGKEEFQTPGDGKLETVVYCVLGRNMLMGLKAVKGTWDGISVEGFVSRPNACKGTRAQQHFFVNGRAIRSRTLSAALEEAYHNQKMTGKFPACVLHIKLSLGAVDVNVHPTKAEVKFADEKRIFRAVYETVRLALEKDQARVQMELKDTLSKKTADHTPALDGSETEQEKAGEKELPSPAAVREETVQQKPLYQIPSAQSAQETKWGAVADSVRVPYQIGGTDQAQPVIPIPAELVYRKQAAGKDEYDASLSMPHETPQSQVPAQRNGVPYPTKLKHASSSPLPSEETEGSQMASRQKAAQTEPVSAAPQQGRPYHPEDAAVEREAASDAGWLYIGEAFDTYIILSQGQKMLFIDKHAAHERILFDKLKSEEYTPMVQRLITPVVWSPTGEEGEVLLRNRKLLAEFGFEAEDFGDGSLVVRGIPFDLDVGQTENVLSDLAEALLQSGHVDPGKTRDQLLSTMACKMAIKGGEKSDPKELKELISAVVTGAVKYCPHGRPISVELSQKELERQFKRT